MRAKCRPTVVIGVYSCLALLLCWAARPSAAETYENPKFGFSFRLPPGAVRCAPDPATGPDHGPSIWLDGHGGECGGKVSRPLIVVVGNYNAMFWATPDVALENLCTGGQLLPPPPVRLEGYASAACQRSLPDGWVYIKLAVMAGTQPPPHTTPEDGYPQMLYTLTLYTTKERLNQDIDRLRSVIASFKIFPPQ